MSDVVIAVENLCKQYRLGTIGGGTLRADLSRWWARRRGQPDPYLRIGQEEQAKRFGETIWALRDVNLEVRQGEILGIIGRNGAGKSTLLKILSRITAPTSGQVKVRGRIGSLLEVGTGFHPELTGRENVFLNGAILGMTKAEVARKFDEIVDFAGIEQFIDTPVKRYSSGMYVRLAFAVAAHLEPEILVVDEVLAVGDAEFQKKCLGKMGEVAEHGRTVLFVSHNMGAINRLCKTSILVDQGRLVDSGKTAAVVGKYLGGSGGPLAERRWQGEKAPGDESLRLRTVRVCQPSGVPRDVLGISEEFEIEIGVEVLVPLPELYISFQAVKEDGSVAIHSGDIFSQHTMRREPGHWISTCRLPPYALNHGTYSLAVAADVPYRRIIFSEEEVLRWTVVATSPIMGRYTADAWRGVIGPGLGMWTIAKPPRA